MAGEGRKDMNLYTEDKEIKCQKGCEVLEGEDLPRCARIMIYGKAEKPHTTIIATCDKQTWRKVCE